MSIPVGRDRLCPGICAALTPVSTGHILVIHRHKMVKNLSLLVFCIWYLCSLNPSAGHILVFHTAACKSSRPEPASPGLTTFSR